MLNDTSLKLKIIASYFLKRNATRYHSQHFTRRERHGILSTIILYA